MSFITVNQGPLEYLTSSLIDVPHAFTTRHGGISEGPFASLNLGANRGDTPGNVLENYRILGNALGFSPEQTVFTKQVHEKTVTLVDRSHQGQGLFSPVTEGRDGLITNTPGTVLVSFMADCVPILLYDPVNGAVAAVHSGWRGTALGIVKEAVEAMVRHFGTDPRTLRAAIGPAIGSCCFETNDDVPQAMNQALGPAAEGFITQTGHKFHVDLKSINHHWLTFCGVEQVDVCQDCTCCQPDRFWSHRITGADRGSLAALICCQS